MNRKRTKNDNVIYSFIKRPARGGSKVIKIEIYEAANFPDCTDDRHICNCNAEVCIQHVVKNIFMDEIYRSVKDLLKKIHDIDEN